MASRTYERADGIRALRPGVFQLRATVNGVSRSETHTGNRTTAKRRRAAMVAEMDGTAVPETKVVPGNRLTFRELAEQWQRVASKRDDWSDNYIRNVEQDLRIHLLPGLGHTDIGDIDTPMLEEFFMAKLDTLARSTVLKALKPKVSAILAYGVSKGVLRFNVCREVKLAKGRKQEIIVPTLAELDALVAAGHAWEPHPWMGYMIELAALIGARAHEMAMLQWRNVDWSASRLGISTTKTARDGVAYRRVKLDPPEIDVLRRLWEFVCNRATAVEMPEPGPSAFLFSDAPDCSQGIKPEDVTWMFTCVREKTNVRDVVTFHCLRHFMATTLLEAGVGINIVQGRGGWSSPAILLNTYAAFLPDTDQGCGSIIAKKLGWTA